MLKVDGNKIWLTRGDSATLKLTVYDSSGAEYDYSQDTVKFTVKRSWAESDALITKTVNADGEIVLDAEDTADLPAGRYVYDVQITSDNGAVDTVIPYTDFILCADVSD